MTQGPPASVIRRRRARPTPPILALVLVLAVALVVAACGSSSPGLASAAVTIRNFAFSPRTVHLRVGGRITFTNEDSTPHTATADNGTSFDSGTLVEGQSMTITFKTPGTFQYHCAFHAFMTGTVIVS
jgi:plastocyanin